jgi:myo-inositol-1(or 4)-monophosphatase
MTFHNVKSQASTPQETMQLRTLTTRLRSWLNGAPARKHNLKAILGTPHHATLANTPSSTPNFSLTLGNHALTPSDLTTISHFLMNIAKDAGSVMLSAKHAILRAASTKNNTSDLVTQYDREIESMVQQHLHAAYPTFSFLGEESFTRGTTLTDGPTFICDPIDGTLNFSKGVPNCAISLAMTLNKKPVVGVVYNPFRGDMYHAVKQQGAFLTRVSTSETFKLPIQSVPAAMESLNACLVAVEWGNQRSGPNWALRTSVHNALLTAKDEGGAMCKSVRSSGSAALNFCYVAQGMLDCFWEGGVWVWDVAGGWTILEEAGGIVASANPGDWEPTLGGRLYFAVRHAKREQQRAVVEELWKIMGERKFVFK